MLPIIYAVLLLAVTILISSIYVADEVRKLRFALQPVAARKTIANAKPSRGPRPFIVPALSER